MPRDITVTFADGSTHVYKNAPDDVTPEQVSSRAASEFGREVASLDGGRKPVAAAPVPAPAASDSTPAPAPPARTNMDMIGMGTRSLLTGAGSLIDVIAGPLNATINALPGKQGLSTSPFGELGRSAADSLGLATPVTDDEKMMNAINEGGVQALLSGGIGAALKGAQGATGMIGTALAEGPAAELVGSIVGNAAAEKVGQEGYGPVAQMLAGLGAGVTAGVGTSVAGSAFKARPEGLAGTLPDEGPAAPPVYRKAELSPEEAAAYTRVHAEGTADEIFDYMKSIGSVDENTADTIAKYVAARDAGKPVGTGVNYIDPDADPAAAKLAGEAEAFRPSREPTVEDLFPTEESRARSLADTEARLQQEATDFQARQKSEAAPAFADPAAAAKAVEDTRVEIAGHTEGWKNAPDFHVVNNLDELDEADRALMDPKAAAAVMPDGRVVFNRENIRSPEHLKAAVFHEMLGHHGLTQRFGAVLDNTIEKIIDSSPDFKARVDEWLNDNPDVYADAPDRVIRAGDEVFAQMSEAGAIPVTVMNRIKNAVKDFLRAAGVKNVEYSNREIETILALAHDAVINGKPRDVAGNGFKLPARFMRETEPEPFSGMTQLPERRRAQEQAYGKEERRQRAEDARGVLSFQKSLVEQNRAEGRDALGAVPPAARFMREPYQKKSTSAESMRTVNDVDSLLGFLDDQNQAIRNDPSTMAELKRQADDLGLTPTKYARGKGIDELPARIMAAHQILTNTVDELAGLGAKAEAEGMSPTLHATILEKLAVVQAVYGRFDNDASAVGRALRTLKEVSESRKSAAAAARFMSEEGGAALAKDPIALQKFLGTLDAVRQTQGPAAAANAIRKAGKYHVEDYASSVVFNFMLSSPVTWIKNAVGAPLNFGMDMVSDGLGAIVGQTSKLPGMKASTDRVMGREMLARLHGGFAAFANWDTYAAIGRALQRGESTHAGLTGKTGTRGLPLSSNKNPLVKGVGLVIENPQRIMAAIDETWAGFFQMSNLYGEAAKQAASEGLTGKAYADRFRELADNPSEAMLEKAHEVTNRQLFRDHDQMSRLARWITDAQTPRFADETQITMQKDVDGKLRPTSKTVVEKDSPTIRTAKFTSRLALPFVPTIDSIARTVIRNTPVSALATALRSTGRERQAAMGRLVASSAVFGYFAMMAAEGNLTGVESPDRDEQATIGAARPPLSIKIGDEWVSYQGFDPIAAPMAMAATAVDRHNKGENTSEAMLGGITGLADALSKSTYMDSTFQLVTMIQEASQSATDGKPLGPTLRNFFAGYGATLATPAGIRWANQKFNDPALRDTTADTTVGGRMASRAQAGWPGLSDELPQRHDVFGRPLENLRQDRMVEKDPVVNEVVRLEELSDKILIGPVGRDVKIGDSEGTVKLNAAQYQEYQKLSGEYLMSDLRDLMATEEWRTYSDEEKLEVIKEIRDTAREDARADLFAEVETAD